MKKVIITGADGFIGSHTVNYFLAQEIEVLAIDICDIPHRLVPDGKKLKYMQCDIANIQEMKEKIPTNYYDTFIHLLGWVLLGQHVWIIIFKYKMLLIQWNV